jgi:hypothetical protein
LFTKVEVRNSQGALLTLQLGDSSNGYNLVDVTGLDPVKATLVGSSFANQPGAVFQSARRDTRQITFKIEFDPDYGTTTLRTLRNNLYSIFRTESQVQLKFFVDDVADNVEDGYVIYARVESSPSSMFAQIPQVDVTLICYDPDFVDPVPVVTTGMTTADPAVTLFDYAGTEDTGILFNIYINRTLTEFVIYYTDGSASTNMDVVGSFIAGDQVTISTVPGNKYATLLRGGVSSSVLYAVSLQSTWMKLAPGKNWIRASAAGVGIPCTVSYFKRFGAL